MELFRRFMGDESSGGDAEKAKKAAQAAALGAALGAGAFSPADAAPRTIEAALSDFERTDALFSRHDAEELARNIEMEAADQPFKGQLAVAQVTIASALSGRAQFTSGSTIEDSVWKKNRFSWTRTHAHGEPLPDTPSFKNLLATLGFALEGKTKAEALSAMARITGLPEDTLFYKRTDWREDDPQETRLSQRAKDMFRSLTKVGEIGDHTFYADRRAMH